MSFQWLWPWHDCWCLMVWYEYCVYTQQSTEFTQNVQKKKKLSWEWRPLWTRWSEKREARLRWFGHVACNDEHAVIETALWFNPGGHWPHERYKKRRMDPINEDMKLVTVAQADFIHLNTVMNFNVGESVSKWVAHRNSMYVVYIVLWRLCLVMCLLPVFWFLVAAGSPMVWFVQTKTNNGQSIILNCLHTAFVWGLLACGFACKGQMWQK